MNDEKLGLYLNYIGVNFTADSENFENWLPYAEGRGEGSLISLME